MPQTDRSTGTRIRRPRKRADFVGHAHAKVVSNDFRSLGLDLATESPGFRRPGVDTHPVEHRMEIEDLDGWIGPAVNSGVARAVDDDSTASRARSELFTTLDRLDHMLTDQGFPGRSRCHRG